MNDLFEKKKLKTRNRVETGMSKKKGTNEANIRPYGPGVTRFAVGSAKSGHKSIKFLHNMYSSFDTIKKKAEHLISFNIPTSRSTAEKNYL